MLGKQPLVLRKRLRHRRVGRDPLGVGQPDLQPVRLKSITGQSEIGAANILFRINGFELASAQRMALDAQWRVEQMPRFGQVIVRGMFEGGVEIVQVGRLPLWHRLIGVFGAVGCGKVVGQGPGLVIVHVEAWHAEHRGVA